MSGDADAIMARLEAMEAAHREDMAAIGRRLDGLAEAHSSCVARCWVGNQAQVAAALKGEG